jgi:hypothetical protein
MILNRRLVELFVSIPPAADELPIIRAHYDLVLWLMPKMGKFPREHRVTLGQRIEHLLYEILEKLIRAKFSRQRRELLEAVNVDLEVLRFQVRLAKDLRCLSVSSYGQVAQRLLDVGRQVGGWMRS